MSEKIIWVGNRESEILCSNIFYKSITMYGSNKGNNVSINSGKEKGFINFIIDSIDEELKCNDVKLFFYSTKTAESVASKAPYLRERIINKYISSFLKFIENKTYSYLWASNIMPIIEFTEMFGNECTYNKLSNIFSKRKKFVIQENYSSGGTGTFVLTEENEDIIFQQLDKYSCYKVSPYYECSYSVNVHIIISNKKISILQPSIQIIENANNRLLYKGADFLAYLKLSPEIKQKILKCAANIGNSLQKLGYLGVCGLDLLVINNNVFFIEINPRFQASSMLINYALKHNSLPDLQTIVYDIFNDSVDSEILSEIENIKIEFSMLSFYQNEFLAFNNYLLSLLRNTSANIEKLIVENEGSSINGEYIFRVIFNTNISSINYDGNLFVYQNLLNYSNLSSDILRQNMVILKCALLTQGVRVSDEVQDLYVNGKFIKIATFDAIDITIDNDIVINCPTKTKFVELSPFSIQKHDDEVALFYLNDFISQIKIAEQEQLPVKYTRNNINIHRIGYLTTDRLRIKHTSICLFKKKDHGCKFCHITSVSDAEIPLDDIFETIDQYQSNVDFKHFLIGGPSNSYQNEEYYVNKIARYIRLTSNKPIYVMSIPPVDANTLEQYYNSGVTEVAFNIEIFDREIAKTVMPGKGDIPLNQYELALKKSSQLFGKENTRSMLIIGLDSQESFLRGIEYLCKLGVTPMISPFRPMDKTELSNFVPPTINYILETYFKTKEICKKYGIKLGPTCVYCQNNTLT